jgi:dCTP deaminase
MFLANEHIKKLCNVGPESLISEATFEIKNVQQASYDLRLGAESYIVGSDTPLYLSKDKQEHLTIAPGQFGLVNISGFHVDPTHKGRLVFAVNNVGPSDVRLRLMEPTFTIFFARVQGSIGDARDPFPDRLPLQYVQNLGGSSVTLSKLQKELEDLKTKVLMYAPLGIALLIALLLNLLKK